MTKGESEQASARYSESLLNIVRGKALYGGNIDKAFHEITEAAANTLGVERASIWLFADNGKKIRCVDLYERGPHRHSEGVELTAADYPAYFAAMEENRTIEAHDAHGDPRTCEFSESYLTPLGIVSMLDAPIHFDGRTIGVICHEHIRQARHWNPAEINYAGSLADLISHALEARDRKQAEEALKESEERFKDYANTSSDYFFEMDENLRFSYFSDRFTEVTGVSPKELLGKTRQETGIPGVDEGDWQRHLADLEAHRPFRNFIHPRTHPDGRTVYLSISGVPVFDADGTFTGYRCTGTNKTIEVEARQALEESEERFRAVVDNSPTAILLKDTDGRYLIANKKWHQWFNPEGRDIAGKTVYDFYDKAHADGVTAQDHEVLETGLPVEREHQTLLTDGTVMTSIFYKFPIFGPDGRVAAIGGINSDITKRKRAEEALSESEERLRGAIESLQEGFMLFDAEDRLVMANDVCRRINPKVHKFLDKGMSFEDLIRANVAEGRVMEALGREEAFIRERLEQHRNPGPPILRQFIDGKWYILKETRTPEGGIALTFVDITDLKKGEEANRRLAEAIEGLSENFALYGPDDLLVMCNRGYSKLNEAIPETTRLGVSYEEHMRAVVAKGLAPKAMGREEDYIRERMERHRNPMGPYEVIRQEGVWLVHEQRVADGSTAIIATDITERKQVEEALQKSQAQLLEAQQIARLGNWSRDLRTNQVNWSDETFRIFGYEPGKFEPTYEKFRKMIHPDDKKKVAALIEMATSQREPASLEYRFVRPDGDVRWAFVRAVATVDDEGNPVSLTGTVQDITERKQAEVALKASQARLAEILDIAPEAVITIGADMNIQLFNTGAERTFGYDAEEVAGQPLDILMPKYFRNDHRRHIEEFDRSGDTYRLMDRRQEIFGMRKDGTEFPASASVSKLEIGGEKIFTVIMQDITERKNAHDAMMAAKGEAETANRAKSEFLAAMSHDLRTPLNAILGFADIISHQYFGPPGEGKYREYARDIHASGEHLLTLVNEILDLSTIEAGKQSLVKEKLSTMEIVKECKKIVEDKARSKRIDLVTKVPKDLPPLYADKRAAKQILLNLLSNAAKFTPEGGKITVSAKASKRNTTLKIADTGKGIPAEKLPNLTDPFTRGELDPYLADEGWGLGLTITKSLIDLHHGKLDIKSKVGKGTTVTVTLPNGAP